MTQAEQKLTESWQKIRDRHSRMCVQDDNCPSKIIAAHSISNKRTFEKLAMNGHVVTFSNPNKLTFDQKIIPVGRNEASTFYGFCNDHDTRTFKPIDTNDFLPENKQQEFLYAYRAFAREYVHTRRTADALKFVIGELKNKTSVLYGQADRYLRECRADLSADNYLEHLFKDWEKAMETFKSIEPERIAFLKNLEKERYYKICSRVLIFNNEYLVAACTVIFKRKLFINIFPQNGKTYVIFSFYKTEKNRYSNWLNEGVFSFNDASQKKFISNLLVHHTENIALSPKLWDAIPSEQKNFILEAFYEGMGINNKKKLHDFNLFV